MTATVLTTTESKVSAKGRKRMAKKKAAPTESIRLDADLVQKARIIAVALKMSLPDYLEDRLRPLIEKELPKVLKPFTGDSCSGSS